MKIDVILITYNQTQYILQALEGIMMQRLNDDVKMRIVVADDCSTDGTLDIIKTYSLKHEAEWVWLPRERNLGITKNYQRAFAAATGDYVAILEGDDYWCNPHHLQKHIDFLEQHRECVLSSSRMFIKDETKGIFETYYPQKGDFIYSGVDQARCNRIGNLSTCVFRGELVHSLPSPMFELEVDDWLLGLELCKYGYIGKLKTPTSVYRINKNSLWAAMSANEKTQRNLDRIEKYDVFLEGIYHGSFMELKHELIQGKQTRFGKIKQFIPPCIVSFLKWIIPPVMIK